MLPFDKVYRQLLSETLYGNTGWVYHRTKINPESSDIESGIKPYKNKSAMYGTGLYCTYRGKKALDGGIATPIPFKNENAEKIFVNVLPDRWPFIRDRAENMKVLNIYESADLHFPMDYWLWKETWADEMFLKGYFAGFKIQKEICDAFGMEMEAKLEPERGDMNL